MIGKLLSLTVAKQGTNDCSISKYVVRHPNKLSNSLIVLMQAGTQ